MINTTAYQWGLQNNCALNQICTPEMTFDEDLIEHARAGYRQIGLWRHKFQRFGIEKGIELIRDLELSISSVSWAGGYTGGMGGSFEQAHRDAFHWLCLCRDIKAKVLIIKTGSQNGHIRSHAQRLVIDGLKKLVPYAERFGVQLAIKPVMPEWGKEWSFVHTIKEACEISDKVNSSHVGVCLSTSHLQSDPAWRAILQQITHHLKLIQIADVDELDELGQYLPQIARMISQPHPFRGSENAGLSRDQDMCTRGGNCLIEIERITENGI